jgi:hypothetical protein
MLRSPKAPRMSRGIPAFALWVVLGFSLALIPLACSSSSSDSDAGPADMTSSG